MSAQQQPSNFNHSTGGKIVNKTQFIGVASLVGIFLLVIVAFQTIGFVEATGKQRVVVENFYDIPFLGYKKGVSETVLGPGRHFYVPALSKMYLYNVGIDNFIMGDSQYYTGQGGDKVDFPALIIKCGGRGQEQPATFSVTLQYQLDTDKLVNLHNESLGEYHSIIIKPALTKIIKDLAKPQHVLDFYTGQGFNDLQNNIKAGIKSDPVLAGLGISVETFVIDQIDLDPDYEKEIQERQLATQAKLKEDELAKAAQAAAKKAEALAQASKLKRIVDAQAKKAEEVLAAEADNESRILAAKAQAAEIKEKAAADRFRKEQDAKGLKAQGLAQAAVDNARKVSRYAGTAGARQAAVEIEHAKTDRLKAMTFNGVVTEKTFMMLSDGKNLNTPSVVVPTTEVGE